MRSFGICTLACACAFALAGCGGGGGGGNKSGSGSNQGGSGTTTPAANLTITVTSPAINASITQGDAYSANVSGTWSASNLGNGSVYLQVNDSANTFTLPAIQAAPGNNAFSYSLPVAAGVANGERNGTLTVRACKDASCNTVYSGASGSMAYRLTVSVVPEWETEQGNAAHNGYVPIQLDASKFTKAWEWAVPLMDGAEIAYSMRPVTGSNGVYMAVENQFADSRIYAGIAALDEDTGSVRWLATLASIPWNQYTTDVAVSGGKVYFGIANANYTLAALDVGTGAAVFTSSILLSPRSLIAPVLYDGSIFGQEVFRNGVSRLVAMSNTTGTLQWESSIVQATEGKPYASPAVDTQHVYYHSACCLEVLDRQSGARVASILNQNSDASYLESRMQPVLIGSRGNVLAFSYTPAPAKRFLSSFNIAGKVREWVSTKSYLPNPAVASGVVYATYIEDSQLKLDALDEATGQVLWTWSEMAADASATATSGGNVIATRNMVFFSAYDSNTKTGKTWAVDLAMHKTVWSYQMSGVLAISSKRMLYLSPYDEGFEDKLIAFKLQ